MTQVGTSAVGIAPADTNASVMIPMTFWASFAPWLKRQEARASAAYAKQPKRDGPLDSKRAQLKMTISSRPIGKPENGDRIIASSTDRNPEN